MIIVVVVVAVFAVVDIVTVSNSCSSRFCNSTESKN